MHDKKLSRGSPRQKVFVSHLRGRACGESFLSISGIACPEQEAAALRVIWDDLCALELRAGSIHPALPHFTHPKAESIIQSLLLSKLSIASSTQFFSPACKACALILSVQRGMERRSFRCVNLENLWTSDNGAQSSIFRKAELCAKHVQNQRGCLNNYSTCQSLASCVQLGSTRLPSGAFRYCSHRMCDYFYVCRLIYHFCLSKLK